MSTAPLTLQRNRGLLPGSAQDGDDATSRGQGRQAQRPQGKTVTVVAPALSKHTGSGLPASLMDISQSADKKWHERWKKGQDILAFPHPFRVCLTGPPNSGKSTAILNIIARAGVTNPGYEAIHVIYPGGGSGTQEFDSLQPKELVKFYSSIPDISVFPTIKAGAKKSCIIIDDLELKEIDKEQRSSLDRIVGHISTHRRCDVFICSQQWVNIPPIARRCCNVFVLWKPADRRTIPQISMGVGEDMEELFKFCTEPRDSIWIDLTPKTKHHIRLNGYTLIKTVGDETSERDRSPSRGESKEGKEETEDDAEPCKASN